ncbi:SUKH superfamily protein [Nonomuraea polychroma]|uniref:SUKH superfamily protein n=1 Tax=Nonomuraea polychroma TaxID=46176 RepID=A0A438LXA4_9ACTN|nr:SUKH superfamily protein [Nonomuraea polychroma]
MWRELVSDILPEAQLEPAVTPESIERVQEALGSALPANLIALLGETNGIRGRYGMRPIWTIEDILTVNIDFRMRPDFDELYMPFDPLLFFGDNGSGDQFAFICKPKRPDVFVWDHETDGRWWVANNLEDYLVRYLRAGGNDDWHKRR